MCNLKLEEKILVRDSIVFSMATLMITWVIFGLFLGVEDFAYIMFVPAIVALVMNYARNRSFRSLLDPLTRKPDARSILFAFLYPLAAIAILAFIDVISGIGTLDMNHLRKLMELPTLGAAIFSVLLMFGEEYGWRGYLLDNIAKIKGEIHATVVVGIIWAVWHGPGVYELGMESGAKHPLLQSLVQMISVFVISFPFSYSYFKTRSIVPPMILHFIWNHYNPLMLGSVYSNEPGIIKGEIMLINGEGVAGILFGLCFILWFTKVYRRKAA